jgi:hypothetical protein
MSSYDDEIQVALQSLLLAGRLRDVGDSDPVFSRLAKAFPINGSKIDWKRVPGAVVFTDQDESSQRQAFMGGAITSTQVAVDEQCNGFETNRIGD